jgi:hypothetical protein
MQTNRSRCAVMLLGLGLAGSFALVPQTLSAAVPQITSFTPTSGPIGTKVVVTGTALTGATVVQFDGTNAVFTGNTATQVTATTPATGTGPIIITTSGGTATSATPFTITPGLQIVPKSGHPSAAVTLTGAGFGPYTSVDVYFDTVDTALAVSNGLGVVSIQIQAPTGAQPGTHWITLDERANHFAAQQPFTVNTNWLMSGFAPTGNAFNPFENTLNTSNVGELDTAWTQPSGGFSNPSPFVEVNGSVVVADITGAIHAYSSVGKLLWTAAMTASNPVPAPASNATFVFMAGGSSVSAFKAACRTDGGVCTPTWSTAIGTTISSGLTVFQNELYVPGADGSVHPLNPATGVAGTPFFGISNSFGAITTPVSFSADGTFFYGAGGTVIEGSIYSNSYGGDVIVSPITVSAGRGFFTLSDGVVIRVNGWVTLISEEGSCVGTAQAPAPAVANNLVYAASCNAISAFESGSGTESWSVATGGAVEGLAVANGVLYACEAGGSGQELVAYDAAFGALLWSGGVCNSAPVVANGIVFGALGSISAYSLPGLNPNAATIRPQVSELKPDYRLVAQRSAE